MRLSAILLTRVIALCGLGETNPLGRVFLPSLLKALVDRYQFQKYPTSLNEINLADGVSFELGYSPLCGTITKLIVYGNGLTLETQSHTAENQAALEDMFDWANTQFDLNYTAETIKRWLYVTSMLTYSEADLDVLHPALQIVSSAMQAYTVGLGRPEVEFKTTRLAVDLDRSVYNFAQAAFLLERDKTAEFGEHKYFSESPFPSEQHLALMAKIERSLIDGSR